MPSPGRPPPLHPAPSLSRRRRRRERGKWEDRATGPAGARAHGTPAARSGRRSPPQVIAGSQPVLAYRSLHDRAVVSFAGGVGRTSVRRLVEVVDTLVERYFPPCIERVAASPGGVVAALDHCLECAGRRRAKGVHTRVVSHAFSAAAAMLAQRGAGGRPGARGRAVFRAGALRGGALGPPGARRERCGGMRGGRGGSGLGAPCGAGGGTGGGGVKSGDRSAWPRSTAGAPLRGQRPGARGVELPRRVPRVRGAVRARVPVGGGHRARAGRGRGARGAGRATRRRCRCR